MNLDRVTITGPDNSIRPEDLIPLSKEFPFVEWGILFSASNHGGPRFPSIDWLLDFRNVARREHFNLSLHICGRYVRQILIGETPQAVWGVIDDYQRMQLNFHAEKNECKPAECLKALVAFSNHGEREFIFQIDGERGNTHLENISAEMDNVDYIEAVGLFDISGGTGILPTEWPEPQYLDVTPGPDGEGIESYRYHGYAGGLGPDNLAEQIPLIGKASKGCRFWIDMETKVRSDSDRRFDLAKVRRCLEISKPFVKVDSRPSQ